MYGDYVIDYNLNKCSIFERQKGKLSPFAACFYIGTLFAISVMIMILANKIDFN